MTAPTRLAAASRPVTFTTTAHCLVKGCGWSEKWQTRDMRATGDQLAYAEQHLARHRADAQHPAPKQPANPRVGVTWRGRTHSVAEWARIVGVSVNTMHYRLENWTLDRALGTPPLPPTARGASA